MVATLTLQSCSLKKNTAASRKYTAFITRYNIYYNGDEHYKKTIADLEKNYQDQFTRTTIFMHPAEAYADEKATQPSGDFKRSIEKAQKAIQIRSIKKRPKRKSGKSSPEYKRWLKREEYNPFLHNAWLMMGRSQYMGGDFLGAASTFFYISKHFWWLPSTVTEAKLWQARSYIAIDWLFEAENLLRPIKEEELTNSTLVDLYNFDMADLYVHQRNYEASIPYLEKAAESAKGTQKARIYFLLGQVCEITDNNAKAYNAYKKVGGMSSLAYRTRFNARIKQSEVFQGPDIETEVKSLKSLTRYGANKEYLDQIYYAIGNLYMTKADTANALINYRKAVESSTRNGVEVALAQIALGQIYYSQGEYDKAQPCYSQSVPQLPDNYPNYKLLKHRSDVLDELAIYSQNVQTQDSLLRLAAMSPEEQRKVIDKTIAELKQREKEEAENAAREEYLAQQAAAGNGLNQSGSAAPTTFALNTDKSWYFYNQATRNAGRTEFQKRWGSRKLEDDWRRRNKASFSMSDDLPGLENNSDSIYNEADADSIAANPEQNTETLEAAQRASDPHFPEYYLRQIPSTDAEKATANEVIQEGLYNMGVILKDRMNDYQASENEFTKLLTRYPDNIYRLDTYYNLYLMFTLNNNPEKAETYRQLILSEFPDTKYGQALADPLYIEKLKRMTEDEANLYEKAYTAYMNNDNNAVHQAYATVKKEYPMSRIMPKFMFLEALSYVTENNPEKFAETLTELTTQYSETDVAPLASSYLKLLKEGRKFNSSGSNLKGMVWSTRLSNDSATVSMGNKPAEFSFDKNAPQLFLLIYNNTLINPKELLFNVARHNFTAYSVRDFELEQLNFAQLGLIVVSGLNNFNEAASYRSDIESSTLMQIPQNVVPLIISKADFDILLNEGRALDEYFDAVGDNRLKTIHESVLPSEEYDEPIIPVEAPQSEPTEKMENQPATENHKEENSVDNVKLEAPKHTPPTLPMKQPSKPLPDYPSGSEGDDPLLD